MQSPRRCLALALLAGALAGSAGPWATAAALAIAVLGSVLFWYRARARGRVRWAGLACGFALAAGGLSAPARTPVTPAGAERGPEVVHLEGVVTRAPTLARPGGRSAEDRELRFPLRTDPPPDSVRSLVEVIVHYPAGTSEPDLRPGDVVSVVGRFRAPLAPSNPGQSDGRERMERRGVAARVYVSSPEAVVVRGAVHEIPLLVRRAAAGLREDLLARLSAAVPDAGHARLLGALLFGERAPVRSERLTAFRSAGVAHVLAVSGLHVVLLISSAAWIGRRLWPRAAAGRRGYGALAVGLLAYVALCRFGTPVVRAAVFLLVAAGGRLAGRRTTTLDHLALAALLVVSVDPLQIREPGFHLSFAAVLGLALLTPRFVEALFPTLRFLELFPESLPRWELRLRRWFAHALSASLAAACATAPVVAATFGALYPVGPLTNLVVVPLVAVALPVAALCCALGGVAPPVTGTLAAAVVESLEGVVGIAAAVPLGELRSAPPPAWAVAGSVLLLAAAVRFRPWKRVHLLVPAAACAVLAIPGPPASANGGPELIALDVGHGLAVLVRDGDRGTVLADAGGRAPGIGVHRIVPALRALGVTRLDALLLSHDDADHCSAAPDVLASIPVGCVIVPHGFGDGRPARAVLEACRRRGVAVQRGARGDRFAAGTVELRVLHPGPGAVGPAGNQGSLVVHVRAGGPAGLSALLPGDLEGAPLNALASDPGLPAADVLVLPHHGLGPPEEHRALAARTGSAVLIASDGAHAPVRVPAALVTGRCGAVRVRPGPVVDTWPFAPP